MGESLPVLAAFGNPLLDVCVMLSDKSVLNTFGLADDSSKEVTAVEYQELLKAVERYPKEVCPGGAALNTLRIFQWLVDQTKSSVFFGSIADDDSGRQLSEYILRSGVKARFKIHAGLLTGSAVCLIHDDLRTLVAHLGAANFYSPADLTNEDKNVIGRVQLVYIENFFVSHSEEVVWSVVELCKAHGVALALNLSGSYLFENSAQNIKSLVKSVNILIGNESEFLALSKSKYGIESDILTIARNICQDGVQTPASMASQEVKLLKLTSLNEIGKLVVITRGSKPVLCVSQWAHGFETPVLQPKAEIKDTTGAGDAFAAGFLLGVLESLPVEQCVQSGCYASTEIIQQVGCRPPDYKPLNLEEIRFAFEKK